MTFDDLPLAFQGPIIYGALGMTCYVAGGFTAWLLMHGRVKHHALRVVRWALDVTEP